MTVFSPQWLALREAADLAARNPYVLGACARAYAGEESLLVCDLGAGTGASVRAFAPMLPRHQRWTLVDNNAANLRLALPMTKGNGEKVLDVRALCCDLMAAPEEWLPKSGLVTASALFDLTSSAWMQRFVTALDTRDLALLATLTFDGTIAASPSHVLDEPIAAAFRAHQKRDKGFGPAAGADAVRRLDEMLRKAGYRVETGNSPWLLDRSQTTLLRAVLDGMAEAVRETGLLETDEVETWLNDRLRDTRLLVVGHCDLFAMPQ